jgi:hypothetical protein
MARYWTGRLAHYSGHRNDEHCSALFEEASRYCGLHLENDLSRSRYWSKAPLHQRAAVLLYLVDKGVVERTTQRGRRVFEPVLQADVLVASQLSLRPYTSQSLELIGALRLELTRRAHSHQS